MGSAAQHLQASADHAKSHKMASYNVRNTFCSQNTESRELCIQNRDLGWSAGV